MRWLIDAQLPRRLSTRLNEQGHDALHTLDLPDGNCTRDSDIVRIASEASRIVISKDRDYVDTYLVTGMPKRLLWVTVGNISNNDLLALFESLLPQIESAFAESNCVELTAAGLVNHQ
jgi:predicted nuclease of predicted toxin-antitoxin system